jgi:hypothetical protein
MNTKPNELVARARQAHRAMERRRRDPRYRRVLGRLVTAGVLTTNTEVEPCRERIVVRDALWAGEIEPRILEVLPALLVKRPGLFVDPRALPEDLAAVVEDLRKHRPPRDFRGLSGASIGRWLGAVGHKGKLPSQLKAFRFQADDLVLLHRLREQLGVTETAVVRRGLRALAVSEQRRKGTQGAQHP